MSPTPEDEDGYLPIDMPDIGLDEEDCEEDDLDLDLDEEDPLEEEEEDDLPDTLDGLDFND